MLPSFYWSIFFLWPLTYSHEWTSGYFTARRYSTTAGILQFVGFLGSLFCKFGLVLFLSVGIFTNKQQKKSKADESVSNCLYISTKKESKAT